MRRKNHHHWGFFTITSAVWCVLIALVWTLMDERGDALSLKISEAADVVLDAESFAIVYKPTSRAAIDELHRPISETIYTDSANHRSPQASICRITGPGAPGATVRMTALIPYWCPMLLTAILPLGRMAYWGADCIRKICLIARACPRCGYEREPHTLRCGTCGHARTDEYQPTEQSRIG
jgi:hypothetical protein